MFFSTMTTPAAATPGLRSGSRRFLLFAFLLVALQVCASAVLARTVLTTRLSDDDTTVVIQDAPEQDVVSFGKTVEVKNSAKSVLTVGLM